MSIKHEAIVRIGGARSNTENLSGIKGFFLFISSLTNNWYLIKNLAWRQISIKYRGSMFGMLWAVFTPLLLLSVYTFVFSVIFSHRWEVLLKDKTNFALFLFAGLICHQFLAECITRSPGLLIENKTYVKKIIFPLEILAWVQIITTLFSFCVSLSILLLMYVALFGLPPVTALLLPLAFMPLIFLGLGISWLFATLGVFYRDMRHVTPILVILIMFLTPIFYPIQAVPEKYVIFINLNPEAGIVTFVRDMLFFGNMPNIYHLAVIWLVSILFASLSARLFLHMKRSFADVI